MRITLFAFATLVVSGLLVLSACGPRAGTEHRSINGALQQPLEGTASAQGPLRPGAAIARLSWMAGHWRRVESDEVMEEHWTSPVGDSMLGVGRYVMSGRTIFYEFLRVEESDGQLIYHAAPEGREPATPFLMRLLEGQHVVFENPSHDFPTRIEYRREGKVLKATVSGEIGGTPRSDTWQWTLVE